MNTTENNKLIAEFMGGYQYDNHDDFITFDETNNMFSNDTISLKNLKFHSDWNWLMEVVEKIESLGYWTEIVNSHLGTKTRQEKIIWCEITKENHTDLLLDDCFTNIVRSEASTKIEAVYKACVDFIKWYNKQKQ